MKRSYIWLITIAFIIAIFFLFIGIRTQNKKNDYQSRWRHYVTVHAIGRYHKDSSGKMTVVITVTNNLPYLVQQARVLVTSMFSDGLTYKSAIVDVYDIPANGFKSKSALDFEIGLKLKTNIGYLKCKELDLY